MSRLTKTGEIAIRAIHVPSINGLPWRKALDLKHVADLAADLKDGKVLNPIRVTKDGEHLVLVQGYHRLAAHQDAGRTSIRADLVRYDSQDEREEDQLCENIKRRVLSGPERDRAVHRLAELRARRAAGERERRNRQPAAQGAIDPQPAEKIPRGRPPSDRRQGIQEAAEILDVSEDSVERSVRRVEAAAQNGAGGPNGAHGAPNSNGVAPPGPPPPPIRTFGLPIADEVLAVVVSEQNHIDRIDRLTQQALAEFTRWAEELPESRVARVNELRESLRRLGASLRGDRPEALCPYCKGRADLVPVCQLCASQRFATSRQMAGDIPKPLLLEGEAACVQLRGYSRPITELEAPHSRGPNGR